MTECDMCATNAIPTSEKTATETCSTHRAQTAKDLVINL
jgi:hypothetical protein